jgi:hypothetical protein
MFLFSVSGSSGETGGRSRPLPVGVVGIWFRVRLVALKHACFRLWVLAQDASSQLLCDFCVTIALIRAHPAVVGPALRPPLYLRVALCTATHFGFRSS